MTRAATSHYPFTCEEQNMLENKLIGFIGVGVMGRPMARRLIEQGHSLVIYDKDADALAELQKIGAHVATIPPSITSTSASGSAARMGASAG